MKLNTLIDFREHQKLTVAQMSEILGVSRSLYQKIEYGNRGASRKFIQRFKKTFPTSDIVAIFFTNDIHNMCDDDAHEDSA